MEIMQANASPSIDKGCLSPSVALWWGMLLFAALSCSPNPVGGDAHPKPPEGLLSRDEFILVLTEIQVVEAVADKRLYRNDNERQRLAEAYNDVWARTGVSAATFDSSYTWWWGHPEAMTGVLHDVVDALKDLEVKSNQEKPFRSPNEAHEPH